VKAEKVIAVARYELYREMNKRSVWLIVALLLLPLVVAVLIRALREGSLPQDPLMWTVILGVDVNRALSFGAGTLAGALSVISWSWLIAILYGGDLFAADLQDGSIQILLSKPVKRSEYVAGKILAATLVISGVYFIAGLGIVAAAWILGGPQERIHEAILLSVLVGVGVVPLLLLSAVIGLKTEKPVLGMILGMVAWFAGSLVVGGLSLYFLAQGDYVMAMEVTWIVSAAFPFFGGDNLSVIVYSWLHDVTMTTVVPTLDGTLHEVVVRPGDYIVLGVVGVVFWTLVLGGLAWWIVSRKDF